MPDSSPLNASKIKTLGKYRISEPDTGKKKYSPDKIKKKFATTLKGRDLNVIAKKNLSMKGLQ